MSTYSICITEHYIHIHIYKPMYIYPPLLEATAPTLFTVWLCVVENGLLKMYVYNTQRFKIIGTVCIHVL